MGLFDSVTSAVNRGTESAGRAAEKVKINSKINELNKRRQQLAAQLGASLYLATKDDAAMRKGREGLYDGIAACDVEREQLQARIAQLDSMSEAAEIFHCAVCGAKMSGGDLFCSGCGTSADKARTAAPVVLPSSNTVFCGSCGAPMNADDVFCMNCGAKVGEVAAAGASSDKPSEVVAVETVVAQEALETEGSAAEGAVDVEESDKSEVSSEDTK